MMFKKGNDMTFEEEKIEELKQAFHRVDDLLKWWQCGEEAFFEAKTSIWHDINELPEGYKYR